MSFKDELKHEKSNKEEKLFNEIMDSVYLKIKEDCKHSAGLGYSHVSRYLRDEIQSQITSCYTRFYEEDLNMFFKSCMEDEALDLEYIGGFIFKEPEKVIETISKKLEDDDLLDTTIIRQKKGELFKTQYKRINYGTVEKGIMAFSNFLQQEDNDITGRTVAKKVKSGEGVRDIELIISWGEDE